MAGIVLALAALTCGNGGPGMGAAREATAIVFPAGEWEGTWEHQQYQGPEVSTFQVRITGGECLLMPEGRSFGGHCSFVADGPRRVLVKFADSTCRGIWKWERGRVVVCIAAKAGSDRPKSFHLGHNAELITLRPAAPRKP
jgi:hypothetical protein